MKKCIPSLPAFSKQNQALPVLGGKNESWEFQLNRSPLLFVYMALIRCSVNNNIWEVSSPTIFEKVAPQYLLNTLSGLIYERQRTPIGESISTRGEVKNNCKNEALPTNSNQEVRNTSNTFSTLNYACRPNLEPVLKHWYTRNRKNPFLDPCTELTLSYDYFKLQLTTNFRLFYSV